MLLLLKNWSFIKIIIVMQNTSYHRKYNCYKIIRPSLRKLLSWKIHFIIREIIVMENIEALLRILIIWKIRLIIGNIIDIKNTSHHWEYYWYKKYISSLKKLLLWKNIEVLLRILLSWKIHFIIGNIINIKNSSSLEYIIVIKL